MHRRTKKKQKWSNLWATKKDWLSVKIDFFLFWWGVGVSGLWQRWLAFLRLFWFIFTVLQSGHAQACLGLVRLCCHSGQFHFLNIQRRARQKVGRGEEWRIKGERCPFVSLRVPCLVPLVWCSSEGFEGVCLSADSFLTSSSVSRSLSYPTTKALLCPLSLL